MTPFRVRPCGHTFSFYFGHLITDPLILNKRIWALSSAELKVSQPMYVLILSYLWEMAIHQKLPSHSNAPAKEQSGNWVSKATV